MIRRFAKPRARASGVLVDMAPLVDMVFLLLIFFVVTTSFVRESGVDVERPTSRNAAAVNGAFLTVAITKEGAVYVGGRTIGADDGKAIAQAMREASTDSVVIQADREAATGLLLRVMDACRAAGADAVSVAAVQP
jgi:biopolymer transport protein ExbD